MSLSIVLDDANSLYKALLKDIWQLGKTISPRGLVTRELIGYKAVLLDPTKNIIAAPTRRLNYHFMLAEWLWIWLGLNRLDVIAPYNRAMREFSDDGEILAGAYGPKFVEQLPYVVRTLQEQESSRQALMTFWRERPGSSKDIPCTISMQFIIRPDAFVDRLHLIVTMRSNDAWLGFPYDLFTFTQIQRQLASRLNVDVGTYTHFAGSMHLYEKDLVKACEVMGDTYEPDPYPQLKVDSWHMPPGFIATFLGLSLMARDTDDSILNWIGPMAEQLEEPWQTILWTLAHRFVKDQAILPIPFQQLIYPPR